MGHNVSSNELIYVELDTPNVERLYVAAQPSRLQILYLLMKENKRMYATQISEIIKIDRKIVTFHLNALEKVDLVSSKYGLSEETRPVAVRYYELTITGREILDRVLEMIK